MYEKTNWKDQEVETPRTYDFSQNSDGTYTLVDAFGEVTELGTAVNAQNMNHIEEGIYNSIDKSQTSNCILEAPVMIDASIDEGVLTLKAGSVVIVPYGTGEPELSIGDSLSGGTIVDISYDEDEDKLFYIVQTDEDLTDTINYTADSLYVLMNTAGKILEFKNTYVTSGTNAPETFNSNNSAIWYDTEENYVKITTSGGSSWTSGYSLAFLIAAGSADEGYTSINQIFQSSGYMASTLWVNKDVKVLIPNGRNSDGTLNNLEVTTSCLKLYTSSDELNGCYFAIDSEGSFDLLSTDINYIDSVLNLPSSLSDDTGSAYYCRDVNLWYFANTTTPDWQVIYKCPILKAACDSSSAIAFNMLNAYNTLYLPDINEVLFLINKIGEPIITLSGTLGSNEIWLNGAEVSKTTYSALYSVYGDTYGTPESTDNFVLPDFRDRAIFGADDFGYLDAGLPDIYGAHRRLFYGSTSDTYGAFYVESSAANGLDISENTGTGNAGLTAFKASTYNSIYGNSNTVQPPAIKVRVKTRYKV